MNRRDCICLFVLALISQMVVGQGSWMIYIHQISLSIQVN